jgi:hypothetical protein
MGTTEAARRVTSRFYMRVHFSSRCLLVLRTVSMPAGGQPSPSSKPRDALSMSTPTEHTNGSAAIWSTIVNFWCVVTRVCDHTCHYPDGMEVSGHSNNIWRNAAVRHLPMANKHVRRHARTANKTRNSDTALYATSSLCVSG